MFVCFSSCFIWNTSCAGLAWKAESVSVKHRADLPWLLFTIVFDFSSFRRPTRSSSLLMQKGWMKECQEIHGALETVHISTTTEYTSRQTRQKVGMKDCLSQWSFLQLSDFPTRTSFGVYLHLYHALRAFT